MGAINNYVDTNYIAAGGAKLTTPGYLRGVGRLEAVCSFVVGSTDTAGSIYRLFKGVPSDAIITSLELFNDALTGATSVAFGLYQVLDWDNVGAIIGSGNQFASALNIASGNAITSARIDCLQGLSIANRNQALWQIAGQAEYPPKFAAYDICMTMTAMTTGATGNVNVKLGYIRGI